MGFFVGTDVGGTFTDMWIAESDGESHVIKSPTTPDVMGGVINCVHIAAEKLAMSFEEFCSQIERFGHGTTVGLNALLTGNAARTAVITTAGFGDTLEIGRMKRQTSGLTEMEVCDWLLHNRFSPLVSRDRVVEVEERIDANGHVVKPLDEAGARLKIAALKQHGVEAIAICTLWSCANPAHEVRLRKLVEEELPGVFITLSNEISPVVGEYARMCTAVANAALGPIAGRYLSKLEMTLRDAGMRVPILMMTSNGGVLPTSALNDRPAIAIFSGPAAGVMGSIAIGAQRGHQNVLAVDIGGTSFDVGVIVDGKPLLRSSIDLAGADISVPSIDVASIGAGGGSIASVRFKDLLVGPKSAGSNPGPACYGRGGAEPTSTDADLVLGVLDPDYFIGGRMKLDADKARAAIDEFVAKPLDLSTTAAAWGIREVLDNKMADLLRRVTIERGHDPRDFVLFANGGAGPSHAWVLARELGLKGFVVPAAATVQSAFGTANADLGVTIVKPVYIRISGGAAPSADDFSQLSKKIHVALEESEQVLMSVAKGQRSFETTVAIRYRGQAHHLDIPVALKIRTQNFDASVYNALVAEFQAAYDALFGKGSGSNGAGFEILSIRVVGRSTLAPPALKNSGKKIEKIGARAVIFDDPNRAVMTTIYRTNLPPHGQEMQGPCIIEYPGQSVVVPAGAVAAADAYGNLEVSFGS